MTYQVGDKVKITSDNDIWTIVGWREKEDKTILWEVQLGLDGASKKHVAEDTLELYEKKKDDDEGGSGFYPAKSIMG